MDRFEIIEKLNEYLEDAEHQKKIDIAKLIYAKHPNAMEDKGAGVNIRLNELSDEFLRSLIPKEEAPEVEFWQTLEFE
jgi:hypothetical protein